MGQNKEVTIRQMKRFWDLVGRGDIHRVNFQSFLDNPSRFLGEEIAFSVWKTVTIGLRKDANTYRYALEATGCRVSNWADDILGRIVFSSTEKEVNLVVRSVAELGFGNSATLAQIYKAARKLGLSLCPAEVGPALRAQYQDQPMGERLVIAMESVTDSDGGFYVFYVVRDGDGLWLNGYYDCLELLWNAGRRFVFVSGK